MLAHLRETSQASVTRCEHKQRAVTVSRPESMEQRQLPRRRFDVSDRIRQSSRPRYACASEMRVQKRPERGREVIFWRRRREQARSRHSRTLRALGPANPVSTPSHAVRLLPPRHAPARAAAIQPVHDLRGVRAASRPDALRACARTGTVSVHRVSTIS
ncbi:hypothetical protein BD310DRAFT_35385 [Dichomitus squalens]|uniref:Uncharacterized protein n=1 Tax=Dichomitus squalens TaxID=114155 RepID=A0A4Q9QFB3_9APHY|nr:hypothetical protein BD310DRAFT_35385 [Dichomitus squalens]